MMSEKDQLSFVFEEKHPHCSVCGKPIRTFQRTWYIYSEFMDAAGRCWDCAEQARKPVRQG